jgi:hypothetical protein
MVELLTFAPTKTASARGKIEAKARLRNIRLLGELIFSNKGINWGQDMTTGPVCF